MAVSCINRAVGHDPVEPAFAEIEGRSKWAIPWLEDDPAMTSPPLWVGRMRRDARDALRYGCNGLIGIHWRTRILGPNVAALAQAAWEQSAWEERIDLGDPTRKSPEAVHKPHLSSEDFYSDWALHEFGAEVAVEAARIFSRVDGQLPRPSDWVKGPGGYEPDDRDWDTVEMEYAFVDEFGALRPKVEGPGALERFDYWLNNFQFLHATGRIRCVWASLNRAMEKVRSASEEEKALLARTTALPARERLVEVIGTAYGHLLDSVNTTGAMGTVCNLEQHTFPKMLEEPGEELARILGEPLPATAELRRDYQGNSRLVVTTAGTSLSTGASLGVKVAVLAKEGVKAATLRWRLMGEGPFSQESLRQIGRSTFTTQIPSSSLTDVAEDGLEYYIEAQLTGGEVLRWPSAAPDLNHTVLFFLM